MELFLDSGMLDDIPVALIEQLSQFAQQKQIEKSSISRSNVLTRRALETHTEWLALQDIPQTILRSTHLPSRKPSINVKSSPPRPSRRTLQPPTSPQPSPNIQPQQVLRRHPSGDDIFAMDDPDVPSSLSLDQPQHTTRNSKSSNAVANPSSIWKAPSVPRCVRFITLGFLVTNESSLSVDMKVVMAEAASAAGPRRSRDPTRPSRPIHDTSLLHPPASSTSPPNSLQPPNATQTKQLPVTGSSPRLLPPLTPPRPSSGTLGPVITPTRQQSATNVRRASS